jgi:NADH-quinone oxidoreductase subunit H
MNMHTLMDYQFLPQTAAQSSDWPVVTLAQRAAQAMPDAPWIAAAYLVAGLVLVAGLLSVMGLVLIYAERKVAGHFQCRLGPMRVGWHGILQTIADTVKLIAKEDITPERADRFLHVAAPFFSVLATVLTISILPLSPALQVMDVNIGVLYLTAVSGFGTLGILLGGWGSNNKWSLLGAMRAGAQMISYEVSATLALLVVVLLSGSMQLSAIVQSQEQGWWIWRAHGIGIIAFCIFFVASIAEINRTPFDIPEGESELTAGFHTEYSGMRFGLFFLSEFVNVFVVSAVVTTLFLGGWMPFHIGSGGLFNQVMDSIPPGLWFAGKTSFLIFLMMWFRWTFPRLRADQLMHLEWKVLLPVGLANLFAAAVMVFYNFYFYTVS